MKQVLHCKSQLQHCQCPWSRQVHNKKKKEPGEAETEVPCDKDPPRTLTTGATSAAAVTIKNNPDAIQTLTVGKKFFIFRPETFQLLDKRYKVYVLSVGLSIGESTTMYKIASICQDNSVLLGKSLAVLTLL